MELIALSMLQPISDAHKDVYVRTSTNAWSTGQNKGVTDELGTAEAHWRLTPLAVALKGRQGPAVIPARPRTNSTAGRWGREGEGVWEAAW